MKEPVTIYQRMGKGVDENIFFRGNTWFSGGTWRGPVVAEGGGGGGARKETKECFVAFSLRVAVPTPPKGETGARQHLRKPGTNPVP